MCLRNFMCFMTLIRSWTSSWCHNGVRLLGDGQVYFACAKNVNCYTQRADHSRSFPKMVATIPPPLMPTLLWEFAILQSKGGIFPLPLDLKWPCDSLESTECGKSDTVWLPGWGFRYLATSIFTFLEQFQCNVRKLNLIEWMITDHQERPHGEGLRLPLPQ